MQVRTLTENFGLHDIQTKVADCAVSLCRDDTARDVAALVFDLHYSLGVLLTHTGDTTSPEVSYLVSSVLAATTSIDNIVISAATYRLSDEAVDTLIDLSKHTAVLMAAFAVPDADKED